MATAYTKSKNAKWLDKNHWDADCYNTGRSIKYHGAVLRAWPDWCADDPEFACIYKYAKALRDCGYDAHVDHIVPIISDIVCGLHVPWNLAIMYSKHNLTKSNNWWPDHPFENGDLFDEPLQD